MSALCAEAIAGTSAGVARAITDAATIRIFLNFLIIFGYAFPSFTNVYTISFYISSSLPA
jgi:ABC-type dipeptide/oligopeptide/nickel transport system permease component